MNARTIVSRNALLMFVGHVLTNALSFITVPLIARWLGSTDYGTMYLAGTVAGFGAMAVECGQDAYLVIAAARSNSRASELIASSMVLRLLLGTVGALVLEVALRMLGYDPTTRLLALMVFASGFLASISTAAMAVVKGLEKMGFNASMQVFNEALHTALLVFAIWIGWRMKGICGVEIATAGGTLLLCLRRVVRMKLFPGRASVKTMIELFKGGVPFFLWTSIVAFQPSLEAVLLSKFGSPDAVGWFGASTKLVNLLLFPAGILSAALSPTLARLYATDVEGFGRVLRGGMRVAVIIGFPMAVGTFLFADTGVSIVFGAAAFARAADNVRALSIYILPVFLHMILGTAILSSGRQLAWALSKGAIVIASAGASLFLIPWFQATTGNGGLGAAWVTAGAELAMLFAALKLIRKGTLDRSIFIDLLRAMAASASMALPVYAMPAAPMALKFAVAGIAYAATLALVGGIGASDVLAARKTLMGAFGRS
jgi:O-antigen/teichoic acid export membrane protein